MKELTIINQEGILLVDSREVAERTEKRHDNLLRDIKGYIKVLEDNSKLSSQNFFIESTYKNSQNKEQPCYLLTRKGCDMVANKMTGEKGILFTAEYVTEFEKMEQAIKAPVPKLSKEIQAIFMLDEKQQKLESEVKDLKDNMPLFNSECKELQSLVRKKGIEKLGGYKSQAYNDNSLRQKVYGDIQRQIKREFGVCRYEAIKRTQYEKAKYIIAYYELPLILNDEVTILNNQIKF